MEEAPAVYRFAVKCSSCTQKGAPCTNTASYLVENESGPTYACKIHGKEKENAQLLPAEPAVEKKKRALAAVAENITENKAARKIRQAAGAPGLVCVGPRTTRFSGHMLARGWENVRPNYYEAGYDSVSHWSGDELSPMAMGPIPSMTGHVNDPAGILLENWWQARKCFSHELKGPAPSGESQSSHAGQEHVSWHGDPSAPDTRPLTAVAGTYTTRLISETADPTRHKYSKKELLSLTPGATKHGDIKVPLFAQWWGADGRWHRYPYIPSRVFYCFWYERFAECSPKLKGLRRDLEAKAAYLRIIGPDCTPTDPADLCESAERTRAWAAERYLDPSVPFGHETVLACLLSPHRPRPWRVYLEQNPHYYTEGFPYLWTQPGQLLPIASDGPARVSVEAEEAAKAITARQPAKITIAKKPQEEGSTAEKPGPADPPARKMTKLPVPVMPKKGRPADKQGSKRARQGEKLWEMGLPEKRAHSALATSDKTGKARPAAAAARVAQLEAVVEMAELSRFPLPAPSIFVPFSLYAPGTRLAPGSDALFRPKKIHVLNENCIDVLLRWGGEPSPGRIAMLDMANGSKPGGAAEKGARAQEETLCRASTLYPILSQSEHLYPLKAPYFVVRNVSFLFDAQYALLETPVQCDVVVVNAVNVRRTKAGWTQKAEEDMYAKISYMLEACRANGSNRLILSAFGRGAFGCPPDAVAHLFKRALVDDRAEFHFSEVVFAIVDDHNTVAEGGNYAVFKAVLDP